MIVCIKSALFHTEFYFFDIRMMTPFFIFSICQLYFTFVLPFIFNLRCVLTFSFAFRAKLKMLFFKNINY